MERKIKEKVNGLFVKGKGVDKSESVNRGEWKQNGELMAVGRPPTSEKKALHSALKTNYSHHAACLCF